MVGKLSALLVLFLLYADLCFASLRDPTRPVNIPESASAGSLQAWELQAIIISKGQKMAIFNGRPLHLGSHLAGFTVVAIKPNTVHLEGPDGKMTLFLFNQTIKKLVHRPI